MVEEDMRAVLARLLRGLQDHAPVPDTATLRAVYTDQWRRLADLVSRAADTGESNSALVIGPRGVGKTALLECVLAETGVGGDGGSVLVRLHGLLQTDDRQAIREITRQLNLEAAVGDRVFGSFAENLAFLLASLREGSREQSKTVIFILEEFDLFCQHKNQTLLYNLFDVAQSAQAPVCIVGLTPRLDVLEMMEKRVKSRFSHRQLYLYGVSSAAELTAVARSYLAMPAGDRPADTWNTQVAQVLQTKPVIASLRAIFDRTRNIRDLKLYLRYVLTRLWPGRLAMSHDDFTAALTALTLDGRAAMLEGLSVLELCLMVAMRHLTQIYEEPFNFEMVLREYSKFTSKKASLLCFPRPVVMKAYENLQNLELIRPVEGGSGGGASSGQREYQLFWLCATAAEVAAAVRRPGAVPTEVAHWADSNVL